MYGDLSVGNVLSIDSVNKTFEVTTGSGGSVALADSVSIGADLTVDGDIIGGVQYLSNSGNNTLTNKQQQGAIIDIGGTDTVTLLGGSSHDSMFYHVVNGTPSIDVNASDRIMLDGVWQDDGDKVTAVNGAGDTIFFYWNGIDWIASSGGDFEDGGA